MNPSAFQDLFFLAFSLFLGLFQANVWSFFSPHPQPLSPSFSLFWTLAGWELQLEPVFMVPAIWLAMQNSSCMGISKWALLKVTARMEARARPGGTRELVAGRSVITHVPIKCFCCKLMLEQLQSTNRVAKAAALHSARAGNVRGFCFLFERVAANSCKIAAPQSNFSHCGTRVSPKASSQLWWAWLLGVASTSGVFMGKKGK